MGSDGMMSETYPPSTLESLQIDKLTCDRVIVQSRLVLLKKTSAGLRVLRFGDSISDISLFESVQCYDDAVDFGQRFVEVPLRGAGRQFDLLTKSKS